jgi:phage-related protein
MSSSNPAELPLVATPYPPVPMQATVVTEAATQQLPNGSLRVVKWLRSAASVTEVSSVRVVKWLVETTESVGSRFHLGHTLTKGICQTLTENAEPVIKNATTAFVNATQLGADAVEALAELNGSVSKTIEEANKVISHSSSVLAKADDLLDKCSGADTAISDIGAAGEAIQNLAKDIREKLPAVKTTIADAQKLINDVHDMLPDVQTAISALTSAATDTSNLFQDVQMKVAAFDSACQPIRTALPGLPFLVLLLSRIVLLIIITFICLTAGFATIFLYRYWPRDTALVWSYIAVVGISGAWTGWRLFISIGELRMIAASAQPNVEGKNIGEGEEGKE